MMSGVNISVIVYNVLSNAGYVIVAVSGISRIVLESEW